MFVMVLSYLSNIVMYIVQTPREVKNRNLGKTVTHFTAIQTY